MEAFQNKKKVTKSNHKSGPNDYFKDLKAL